MASPSLETMLRLAGEQAERVLIEMRQPQLVPSYVIFNETGAFQVIAYPWHDDAEKAATIEMVRAEARRFKATKLSLLSEAWVVDSRETPDALLMRPRENPARREIVTAVATDGTEIKTRDWQIVRDRPGGSIIALVEHKPTEEIVTHSWLIEDILPKGG